MKKRVGFVSNSSSSSFVVLGYKMESKDLKELLDKLSPEKLAQVECDEDLFWDEVYSGNMFNGVDTITDDGTIYLGEELCNVEDWGLSASDTSLDELVTKAKEMQEALQLGYAPQLYTGTRAT